MTRTFANKEELRISLIQGEKWHIENRTVVYEYDKFYNREPFRAIETNGRSNAINNSYIYCDGKTVWHKVEEKTELDLIEDKYKLGYTPAWRANKTDNYFIPTKDVVTNVAKMTDQKIIWIAEKHKDILDAYLADNNVEIEYVQGIQVETGFKDWTADKCFIEDYLENAEYRIKPEIWIKTTTISLAMYTCYDARSNCWINPIICETMEECKIKLDESYFSLHTEIPNTRFETVSDKDRFEQNKWNTKLTDLTL